MAITFSKWKGTTIDSIGRRIFKVFELGPKTAKESSPFGLDSNVNVKDMTAIFCKTSNDSETVIIGFIQKERLAGPGETRIFSLDENGVLSAHVWCKNDGTLNLNGDVYTSVRFSPLQDGLNAYANLVSTELAKVSTSIGNLGGVYTPVPPTFNISNSESPDVKLK